MGRNGGRLVALVGDGANIRAFDAVSGDPVGQFTTTNLGSLGLTAIDGIGSTDTRTVISDSSCWGRGLALRIDVTASLATGHAVAVGQPYVPERQFELLGRDGQRARVGNDVRDRSRPLRYLPAQRAPVRRSFPRHLRSRLPRQARTALKVNGNFVNAGPEGSVDTLPPQVLGSVDQSLALITGVANGKNTVALLNPQTLASNGTLTLDSPNLLTGLSESFRPDLANSALIDVQGNVQSLRAKDATGMVFNVAGFINLAKIHRASNSVLIGQPFGHAEIPRRSNVDIISSPARSTDATASWSTKTSSRSALDRSPVDKLQSLAPAFDKPRRPGPGLYPKDRPNARWILARTLSETARAGRTTGSSSSTCLARTTPCMLLISNSLVDCQPIVLRINPCYTGSIRREDFNANEIARSCVSERWLIPVPSLQLDRPDRAGAILPASWMISS